MLAPGTHMITQTNAKALKFANVSFAGVLTMSFSAKALRWAREPEEALCNKVSGEERRKNQCNCRALCSNAVTSEEWYQATENLTINFHRFLWYPGAVANTRLLNKNSQFFLFVFRTVMAFPGKQCFPDQFPTWIIAASFYIDAFFSTGKSPGRWSFWEANKTAASRYRFI